MRVYMLRWLCLVMMVAACSGFRLASHLGGQPMRAPISVMNDEMDVDTSSPAYRAQKEAEKREAAEARRQRAVEVRHAEDRSRMRL